MQNVGAQVFSFVIQIVLARLLSTDAFGIVAIASVFMNIAVVIVQTGFSSAIIQQKSVTQRELNSVFYFGILLSITIYLAIFFLSPLLANYYQVKELSGVLKIQALTIILASLSSVPQALIRRTMLFKKSFVASMTGSILQGIVGITMAYRGYGVWALVTSYLVGSSATCFLLFLQSNWLPSLSFSTKDLQKLFGFSSRILLVNLTNTIYNSLSTLIIGRQYGTTELAYYNRGFQFPTLIMTNVDGAMVSVLFSALSQLQEDTQAGLRLLRRSIKTSMYVCAPLMIGMAMVAEPMVKVLLTEQWLRSVPYIRIICLDCMLWPLSAKLQAFNALGKSGLSLKISLCSKAFGFIMMFIFSRFSPVIFATTCLFASFLSIVLGGIYCNNIINYRIKDQIIDVLPIIAIAVASVGVVYPLVYVGLKPFLLLGLQIIVAVLVYILISAFTRNESFVYILQLLKDKFIRKEG